MARITRLFGLHRVADVDLNADVGEWAYRHRLEPALIRPNLIGQHRVRVPRRRCMLDAHDRRARLRRMAHRSAPTPASPIGRVSAAGKWLTSPSAAFDICRRRRSRRWPACRPRGASPPSRQAARRPLQHGSARPRRWPTPSPPRSPRSIGLSCCSALAGSALIAGWPAAPGFAPRRRSLPIAAIARTDRSSRAREPGAVIDDPAIGLASAVAPDGAGSGSVVSVDGTPLDVDADTICVHGDTPGAALTRRAASARALAVGRYRRSARLG